MRALSTDCPPTESQLRYLRMLAERTETTFASPSTRAQASSEIARLKCLPAAARVPSCEREGRDETEPYGTAVGEEEVSGYGASAGWLGGRVEAGQLRHPAAAMAARRAQLARYRISGGERVLCAERIAGELCVVDLPAQGGGRRYVVERGVRIDGEKGLQALLADYVAQAKDADRVPMATSALGREIEADA